jgi:hypothetical protein
MTEKAITIYSQINNEKTIFWTLIGILFLCAGFYIYFIDTTIHNVVARQNLENEATSLTLSIGSQEFQYISKRNAVTLDLAYSMGFKDIAVKEYVSKKSPDSVAFLSR